MSARASGPNPKIYGAVVELVPIEVLGRRFEVPEGIPLIRAFQYIQFELGQMICDWSLFCFNDTIGCCNFRVRPPSEATDTLDRACCVRVSENLVVTELPQGCRMLDESEGSAGIAP
jgi:hypothetical protein